VTFLCTITVITIIGDNQLDYTETYHSIKITVRHLLT